MARHSDGLNVKPDTARGIDRGWDGPEEDDEVFEIYGDAETVGVSDMHSWDIMLEGVTVMSVEALREYLRRERMPVEEFKRMTAYRSNLDRDGFGWLRAL